MVRSRTFRAASLAAFARRAWRSASVQPMDGSDPRCHRRQGHRVGRRDCERAAPSSAPPRSPSPFSRLHADTITRRLKTLAGHAGLPEIGLHDVRHSYATAGWSAKGPERTHPCMPDRDGAIVSTWRPAMVPSRVLVGSSDGAIASPGWKRGCTSAANRTAAWGCATASLVTVAGPQTTKNAPGARLRERFPW
jgi:hypothetical protein